MPFGPRRKGGRFPRGRATRSIQFGVGPNIELRSMTNAVRALGTRKISRRQKNSAREKMLTARWSNLSKCSANREFRLDVSVAKNYLTMLAILA